MAKVLMPLLSDSARGAIAETLVYFPWKGLNAVRSYVVPANPNTAAQQVQRGYMIEAVLQWRTLGYTAVDKTGYNAWALLDPKPMSGFNKYVSLNLKTRVETKGFTYPFDVVITTPGAGQITLLVKVKDDVATYTSRGYFDTKQGGTLLSIPGTWLEPSSAYEIAAAGLGSGVNYWCRVWIWDATNDGWIGDFKVKTV